jgi:hypothetical protein
MHITSLSPQSPPPDDITVTTLKPIPTTTSSKAIITCTINPTQHHFNIMKLLSTTTLFLASLFTTTTLANLSLKFEALPSNLGAGASYDVKWTSNQDFVSSLTS